MGRRSVAPSLTVAALVALAAALVAVAPLSAAEQNSYTVTRLASDLAGAVTQDANLVNGWGLVAGPTSPWWVANNGTDTSTLYRGDGSKVPLTVAVGGGPTGVVNNSGSEFLLGAAPARFIFASQDGRIRAWNGGPSATVVAAGPAAGTIYTGLAISGSRLYAANLAGGVVDVFDAAFAPTTVPGGFADPRLPAGYGPFGIQAIGDRIFVAFVKQEDGEEQPAQGVGVVDAFDADGNLLARVAQHGQLNAPWGMAQAPAGFGRFGGDLLVGNFGDGTINAYEELPNGRFEHRGQLRGQDGQPLVIDGLWALEFGFGNANSGPATSLFFTAGPDDERHGLFGSITAG